MEDSWWHPPSGAPGWAYTRRHARLPARPPREGEGWCRFAHPIDFLGAHPDIQGPNASTAHAVHVQVLLNGFFGWYPMAFVRVPFVSEGSQLCVGLIM